MSTSYKKKSFSEAFLETQQKWINFLFSRVNENVEEKKLWQKFNENVKEHFKDPTVPKKFHLEHINKLGVNWDILFLYTKKDVGKNTQIRRFIREQKMIYPDMQIVYIRNTKEELKGLAEEMENDDWPIYFRSEKLFWKNPNAPRRRSQTDKQAGIVAYASSLTGFTKWQGGEYGNVKLIVWDECNSLQGGLDVDAIKRFVVFQSSIIRDKEGVKSFMFGNHLTSNNIFLNSLHLSSNTCLKVLNLEDKEKGVPKSKLLYINTKDLYDGIDKQQGLAWHFDFTGKEDLLTNSPKHRGLKNLYEEHYFFTRLKPRKAIVFSTRKLAERDIKVKYLIMYIAQDEQEKNKFGIWMEEYVENQLKPGYIPIGWEQTVLNIFQYVRKANEKKIGSILRWLKRANNIGAIWYGTNNTFALWETVVPELEAISKKTDPVKNIRKNKF